MQNDPPVACGHERIGPKSASYACDAIALDTVQAGELPLPVLKMPNTVEPRDELEALAAGNVL